LSIPQTIKTTLLIRFEHLSIQGVMALRILLVVLLISTLANERKKSVIVRREEGI
jgi:hypothetical protein